VERIWDKFLTKRDREVFAASGYGSQMGFGGRPALLIVDVSYGFTGDRPEPILDSIKRWRNSSGSESWKAVEAIKRLATAFRGKSIPVIYTTASYRTDNWDAGSWTWKNNRSDEPIRRPQLNRDENEIVSEIAPEPQDLIVYKQKPSGFFGSNLMSYLTMLACDSLIITGGTTSGCVRATVVDAFSYNFRCSIVEDGCFDRSEASHAISLCDMHAKYGDVIGSEAVLKFIESLPGDLFPNLPRVPK
jgi:nicotinamidase-related amidase